MHTEKEPTSNSLAALEALLEGFSQRNKQGLEAIMTATDAVHAESAEASGNPKTIAEKTRQNLATLDTKADAA